MLVMMAVGIPVYVCATASVPIAAALVLKGVSPGAALVFLMTGPATNAATIATVWKIMGRRVAAIYLASVGVSALAAGLLLDAILPGFGARGMAHGHWMLPGPLQTLFAVVLLGVIAFSFVRPTRIGEAPKEAESARTVRIGIGGMTCSHCAAAAQRALAGTPGVVSAVVDLKRGEAVVSGEGFDPAALARAVESAGYTPGTIEDVPGSTETI